MKAQTLSDESKPPVPRKHTHGVVTGHAPNSHPRRPIRTARRNWRSGVAAVEFAVVAPVFLLLVFGLVEFGRMMMVQQSLTNAAREGCRAAAMATTTNTADVDDAVRDYLQPIVANASNPSQVRVTVPASLVNCPSGTELTVSVEVDYADVSWMPASFLGLNPTVAAEQTARRE